MTIDEVIAEIKRRRAFHDSLVGIRWVGEEQRLLEMLVGEIERLRADAERHPEAPAWPHS